MAKIKLVDTGFTMIPEGWHVFKIEEVDYDEDFGKMQVKMITKEGMKHIERFGLLNKMGETNEGAIKAFSYFAKTCLNNFDLDEIDEQDLVGCYIKCNVKHVTSDTINEKTGEPYVNVNLTDKMPAVSFNDTKEESNDEDLDDLDELDELDELDDLD